MVHAVGLRGRDEAIAVDAWQMFVSAAGLLGVGGVVTKLVERGIKQRDDAPKLSAEQTRAATERAQMEAEIEAKLRAELRAENATLRLRAVETEENAAKRIQAAEERYREIREELGMVAMQVDTLIKGARDATADRDALARRLDTVERERTELIAMNDGLRAQNLELKSANDALRSHNATLINANGQFAQRTSHLESDLKALQDAVATQSRRPPSRG